MTIASAIKKMNSKESREYLLNALQSSNVNQNFESLIFCLSKKIHVDLIDEKLLKNIFFIEGNKYTSYNYIRSSYLNKFNDKIKKAVDLIFENKEVKEKFISLLRKEFLNIDGYLMISSIWYVFKYYISKEDLKSFDEIIYAFVCDDVRTKDYEKYLNFYKKQFNKPLCAGIYNPYEGFISNFYTKEIFLKYFNCSANVPIYWISKDVLQGLLHNKDGYEIFKYISNQKNIIIHNTFLEKTINYCIKYNVDNSSNIFDLLLEKYNENLNSNLLKLAIKNKNKYYSKKIISRNERCKDFVHVIGKKNEEFLNRLNKEIKEEKEAYSLISKNAFIYK